MTDAEFRHELLNPVNVILLSIAVLKHKEAVEVDHKRALERIERSARKLQALVEESKKTLT